MAAYIFGWVPVYFEQENFVVGTLAAVNKPLDTTREQHGFIVEDLNCGADSLFREVQ